MYGSESSTARKERGLSLRQILPSARFHNVQDMTIEGCSGLWSDCQPNDLFAALVSPDNDGHDDINRAVSPGAKAILTERLLPLSIPQCIVEDSRVAYGKIAHALAGSPCGRINSISVTGSDGKSTTAHLIQSVFSAAGFDCAVGSANEVPELQSSRNGTPSQKVDWTAPAVASFLANQVLAGQHSAIVEASECDLRNHNLSGCEFQVAVVTNIRSRMQNGRQTQLRALDHLAESGMAVLNADDPVTGALLEQVDCGVLTIGIREDANVEGKILESSFSDQTFMITAGNESIVVQVCVPGAAHVYNCLQAAAVGLLHGIDLTTIARGIEQYRPLAGRMEVIRCGQEFPVIIDQADTPWRLGTALNMIGRHVTGKIFCVFSAGDDCSPQQAHEFGRAAERGSQVPVITRCELGKRIDYERGHQVLDGFRRPAVAHFIPDRMTAIEWALSQARAGDAVLIAGAGGRSICSLADDRWHLTDSDICKAWLWGDNSVHQTIVAPPVDPRIFRIDDYRPC